MGKKQKEKVLETLIKQKGLKKEEIREAEYMKESRGITIEEALIEKGLIQEEEWLALLTAELGIPYMNLSKYKIDSSLSEILPEKIARQYKIVPISSLDKSVTIAMSNPLDIFILDDLKQIIGRDVDYVMSASGGIRTAIDGLYGAEATSSVSDITQDIDVDSFEIISDKEGGEEDVAAADEGEKAPIIRMVNLVLKEALRQKASDIHIEPELDNVRVRYRIDGVLQNVLNIPKDNQTAVTVRIKIMSRMDITVNQVPQDGRFQMKIGSKEVDFRVSLLPTTFGQKIVMRILDKGNLSKGIEGLSLSEKTFATVKSAIQKPFGMILITGPTGSGKSTTLYSMINELNTVDKNIITVEDPVEYLIEGLTQIQANADIGLTFANGLRAILRQSPDVVMVGEIRDNETADIAIKASLTGQLVLSTLHTNDAAGALTRLIDMGVEPFLVASSIILVSAQRLCRRICPKCKEKEDVPEKILKELKYDFPKDVTMYRGKGCEACRDTGYQGRMSITEVLEVDEVVRDMLLKGDPSDAIKEYARTKKGMDTLYEDAMLKCLQGITSLEEVLRVTSSD